MKSKRVEILAPAGDYDCFLAAIHAGADAVYLGGNFSARAYAKNFSDEEILSAIDYAHFYGRKVYMTLNIVMKQEELYTIAEYLMPFYVAGLDGVIVQDIGLVKYISELFPNLLVHASTQMTITDIEGVRLMKRHGIKRVVLARELSLKEISFIHDNCDTELECFVHGALCYSYSGKCLMSGFLGGRSGNRGRCAGTCRLPYDNEYPLSCKDICTLQILPKLIEAGICSFKIEGRMKSPEYVAGVVGIYKKYIDMYYSAGSFSIDSKDYDTLLKLYTRSGNCEGYYNQKNGRDMITISKPGYSKGDDELSQNTFKRFTASDIRREVSFDFFMKKDEMICLVASCGDFTVSHNGEIAQPAINRPTSEEDVIKQLNKLGNTEFKPGDINVYMDDGLFIQLSKINEIRRNTLLHLKEEMLREYRRISPNISQANDFVNESESKNIKLHVYVKTLKQARAALQTGMVAMLSIDFWALLSDKSFLDALSFKPEIYIVFPYVVRHDFTTRYKHEINSLIEDKRVNGVIVNNYELLGYFDAIKYNGKIITDLHLYALNYEAVSAYKELGATTVTTPVELNKAELLRRNVYGEDMIVYGYIPLMVSAQCVQNTNKECNHANSLNILKDRMHKKFYALSDCRECLSIIYNSVPISLHKDMELIRRLKPNSVRLMFTIEKAEEVSRIIDGFNKLVYKNSEFAPQYEYTRGHLTRGVE